MRMPDMEDRQAGVAIIVGVFMGFIIPLLTVLILAIATTWCSVFGILPHETHRVFWGWLSTTTHTKHDGTVWSISNRVAEYYGILFTVWFAYEIGEGLGLLGRAFHRALIPRRHAEIVQEHDYGY